MRKIVIQDKDLEHKRNQVKMFLGKTASLVSDEIINALIKINFLSSPKRIAVQITEMKQVR